MLEKEGRCHCRNIKTHFFAFSFLSGFAGRKTGCKNGLFLCLCKLLKIRCHFSRKIQGTYFKISALYFKIYGLYFLQDALCFFASPSRPKILPVANEFFLLSSGFPGLLCPDIDTCLRGQRMTERNILRNFAESWKIFRQRPLQTG